MQNTEQMSTDDVKEWLLNIHEKILCWIKKVNELLNSFWESYSSFSNSSGGIIILGVLEGGPQNEIIGVGNSEKILTSLWDQLSNTNKVSYRNVDNQDVNTYIIDGKNNINQKFPFYQGFWYIIPCYNNVRAAERLDQAVRQRLLNNWKYSIIKAPECLLGSLFP